LSIINCTIGPKPGPTDILLHWHMFHLDLGYTSSAYNYWSRCMVYHSLVGYRPQFRHGQGVRPQRGIHHFGASTNQRMFYLFVLLLYIDYTMRNHVHNIYDIYDILMILYKISPYHTLSNLRYGNALAGKCAIWKTF